jgi:hypothetical protein
LGYKDAAGMDVAASVEYGHMAGTIEGMRAVRRTEVCCHSCVDGTPCMAKSACSGEQCYRENPAGVAGEARAAHAALRADDDSF